MLRMSKMIVSFVPDFRIMLQMSICPSWDCSFIFIMFVSMQFLAQKNIVMLESTLMRLMSNTETIRESPFFECEIFKGAQLIKCLTV